MNKMIKSQRDKTMAAKYIQPSLDDFEAIFGGIKHKQNGGRAFVLVQPRQSEMYYLCILRSTSVGQLCLRVWTSIAAGNTDARDCGTDAIRCSLVWHDAEGWEKSLGKCRRVNRCGGPEATAADVVERALLRARDVASCRGKLPACPLCGRPMTVRIAKSTGRPFYGCIAWQPKNEGCSGVRWEIDKTDPFVREQVKKRDRCKISECRKLATDIISNAGSSNGRYCSDHYEGMLDGLMTRRMGEMDN